MQNTIEYCLRRYKPLSMVKTPYAASVLVMLMENEEGNLSVILTKRASSLSTYAGDFSFPGGMFDETDIDFIGTVQREVKEELNLDANLYEIIGNLDDFLDRYGNVVRPFVATIKKSVFESHYKKCNEEIESLYYFPIKDLDKIEVNSSLEIITKRHPSYCFISHDVKIWGLTASIMVHLGNIIFNLNKPVGKLIHSK